MRKRLRKFIRKVTRAGPRRREKKWQGMIEARAKELESQTTRGPGGAYYPVGKEYARIIATGEVLAKIKPITRDIDKMMKLKLPKKKK
ncbi:MAG: hypothetical protein WC634_04235 [archaeon]